MKPIHFLALAASLTSLNAFADFSCIEHHDMWSNGICFQDINNGADDYTVSLDGQAIKHSRAPFLALSYSGLNQAHTLNINFNGCSMDLDPDNMPASGLFYVCSGGQFEEHHT